MAVQSKYTRGCTCPPVSVVVSLDIQRYGMNFICTIVKVKVKVKFTLEQATKAQRGSRGIALLFL
jgi:hypothetical protein